MTDKNSQAVQNWISFINAGPQGTARGGRIVMTDKWCRCGPELVDFLRR